MLPILQVLQCRKRPTSHDLNSSILAEIPVMVHLIIIWLKAT